MELSPNIQTFPIPNKAKPFICIVSPVGGLGKSKEVKDSPEIVVFYQMAGIHHYFTLKDCLLKN
ncbi:MAG: hypothetical protein WCB15_26695, partial [Desulfobacterales bacterium]